MRVVGVHLPAASVALVQACQDARRAYKNWFDSLAGRRKGPAIRHPRPRRKRGRQCVRFTRNGFAMHGERLYVAKVGDIKVEWSRGLPSIPSSVTVIREPDGRYYASFVVEREATPLPACGQEIGIDLGLNSLIVTSGGEIIANPRFARRAQRRLRRAQRVLSRRQKGSKRSTPRTCACPAWPTSQVCSACGVKDGPKPLHAREWTCAACGTVHDRDVNAAKNILAAGRADKSNACGAGVRPHLVAVGAEAGTHRSAA